MVLTNQQAVLKDLEDTNIILEGFSTVGELSSGVLRERQNEKFASIPFTKVYQGHVGNMPAELIENLGGVDHLNSVLETLEWPPYVLIKINKK